MASPLSTPTSIDAPDPQALLEEAEAIFLQHPKVRCVAYRTRGRWTGPSTHLLSGHTILVREVESPLEARLALLELHGADTRLVLLTAVDEHELGQDVVARFYKQRLTVVRSWETIKSRLKVRDIDPQLLANPHLATFLLEALRIDGSISTPNAILTADFAWEHLFAISLELPRTATEHRELLRACAGSAFKKVLQAPEALYEAAACRLQSAGGALSASLLRCIRAGHAAMAIPIGVACGVVFRRQELELAAAAGRLEQYTGGTRLTPELGGLWAAAAREVLDDMPVTERRVWRDRSDELLTQINVESWAWLEPLSFLGEEQRLDRLADALLGKEPMGHLESVIDEVRECPLLPEERKVRAEMAGRLKRWLAGAPARNRGTLADEAIAYIQQGAFVDQARHALRQEEPGAKVSTAYQRLLGEVSARREEMNCRFAGLLTMWSEEGGPTHGVLGVEHVLGDIVVPLLRGGSRVLLLVLDGLSWAVAHALLPDFENQGWGKVERKSGIPPVIAAFPTVTECSRASLVSGSLVRGDAAVEKTRFEQHPVLRALSGKTPRLFHKSDLPQASLTDSLRECILDDAQKIVGVVLNTIDDTLAKDDQLHLQWSIDAIRPLASLLTEARRARRVVVLASDHGHILDNGTELRSRGGAARWSLPTQALESDEVLLTGPRVLLGDGRVVVPWTEKVRYATRHCGYHGGITPQEALPPLVVLAPLSNPPKGWTQVPLRCPEWWDPTVERLRPAAPKKRKGPQPQLELALDPSPMDYVDTLLGPADEDAAAHKLLTAMLKTRPGERVPLSSLAQLAGVPEPLVREVVSRINRAVGLDGDRALGIQEGGALLDRQVVEKAVGVGSEDLPPNLWSRLTEVEAQALNLLVRERTLTEGQFKRLLNTSRVAGVLANLAEKLAQAGWKRLSIEEGGAEGHLYLIR